MYLGAFGRPFGGPEEMDDALFASWCRPVGMDDVIVCLGDVSLLGLFGRRLRRLRRLRAAPGRKVLVLGNHDAGVGGVVVADGFDEVRAGRLQVESHGSVSCSGLGGPWARLNRVVN